MHALPDRLRDDARHERPGAGALPELRRPIAPSDLGAEDQSVQFFEPDRGEIRQGLCVGGNRQGAGAAEGVQADVAPAAGQAQSLGLVQRSKKRLLPTRCANAFTADFSGSWRNPLPPDPGVLLSLSHASFSKTITSSSANNIELLNRDQRRYLCNFCM